MFSTSDFQLCKVKVCLCGQNCFGAFQHYWYKSVTYFGRVTTALMAKPLLASTFFSFPKLLLWSLPLIAILVYTYLANGLAGSRLLPLVLQIETWEHKLASHVRSAFRSFRMLGKDCYVPGRQKRWVFF